MGNSSSNSAPCSTTKLTNQKHRVFGILSHSGASSLTTTDTIDSAQSSLSTNQSSHSAHTTDEDIAAEHGYYPQNGHRYSADSLSVDCDFLEERSSNSFNEDDQIASSFELIQPDTGLFDEKPQYRPHSVLGVSEQLHNSISSCTSSNNSRASSTDLSLHQNKYSHNLVDYDPCANKNLVNLRRYGQRKEQSGIGVPVMPLPRSKSFHQILRPTPNGHILASKGTIRGANKSKQSSISQKSQPLASRVKHMFVNSKNNHYDLLPTKKVSFNIFIYLPFIAIGLPQSVKV